VDSIDSFHVQKAINKSNLAIRQKNEILSGRMGATMGGIVIKDAMVTYFLVGDVKIFHFRSSHLIFESTAHSLVSDLIMSGSITEPTQLSKYKHVVTRCIQGDIKLSQAEFNTNQFQPETDIIIVCSDGVHDRFDSLQIENMIIQADSPKDLFRQLETRLVDEATDNFSFGIITSTNSVN
jgi:protein phosphatase